MPPSTETGSRFFKSPRDAGESRIPALSAAKLTGVTVQREPMPPNPVRRTLIVDTAIEILADTGCGGVNHRQIDERAQLPPGTTSNYFRTRLSLLEATARRMAELHWQG